VGSFGGGSLFRWKEIIVMAGRPPSPPPPPLPLSPTKIGRANTDSEGKYRQWGAEGMGGGGILDSVSRAGVLLPPPPSSISLPP
jgi:hypothetical protein